MGLNFAKIAMDILRRAMAKDEMYAWSWHCNLACMAMDAGASPISANERAASFMMTAFDVDTSKTSMYQHSLENWKKHTDD